MPLLRRAAGLLLLPLLATQTGCANTLEAIGGGTVVVGATTLAIGSHVPASYDCNAPRSAARWCLAPSAPPPTNAPTDHPANVSAMITGASLIVVGVVLWGVGFSQRPRNGAHAPAPPPPPRGNDSDPEQTLLE